MALALLIAISELKKVLIFKAHLFQWPLLWMLPASKSLCPAPYKQQEHKGTVNDQGGGVSGIDR